MPERKKKLRRQKSLHKQQIAVSQVQSERHIETVTSTANIKASCKSTERKEEMKARKRKKDGRSYKHSNECNIKSVNIGSGNSNPINLQVSSTKSKVVSGAANAQISKGEEAETVDKGHEWTKEQDVALQNAYFQVRPSPNFWFEVSKKVSCKTAKDCFDRFYSAHPTPPVTQSRSRKATAGSPVRPISFSSPMSSLNSKVNFGRGKQGLLKAHKTVRNILRRQRIADGSYEADVFPLVELNPNISMLQRCTPRALSPLPALEGKETFAESCIATRAALGRIKRTKGDVHNQSPYSTRSSIQGQVLSPEVLKAEVNPGRLDRFLDILHSRRVGGRKNSCAKGHMQSTGDGIAEGHTSFFAHRIAAAREAIISDAKDVLKTALRHNSTEEEEDYEEDEKETSLIFDDAEDESLDF